jgi:hypothetical protein
MRPETQNWTDIPEERRSSDGGLGDARRVGRDQAGLVDSGTMPRSVPGDVGGREGW